MDWANRKVLSFRLSNTLDTSFCTEALEEVISRYWKPHIFNTDQGSQFTSEDFTGILMKNDIKISMDGRGRWIDNVFIERLWKSVKYEDVYLMAYHSISEATKGNDVKIIEAVFENRIFRPLTEPHFKNHPRVRIEILSGDDKSSVESQKKTLLEFAGVGKGRFTDVARNHDRYLYSKD